MCVIDGKDGSAQRTSRSEFVGTSDVFQEQLPANKRKSVVVLAMNLPAQLASNFLSTGSSCPD